VNEGVVEAVCGGKELELAQASPTSTLKHDHVRGKDVSDTEDQTIFRLGAEVGNGVFLGLPDFGSLLNGEVMSCGSHVHIRDR
jgi:hypothetical protein